MHLYISPGERRVTISCGSEVMKVKGPPPNHQLQHRRYSYRSLLPTALILGILLPFLFIRTAFLVLDGTSFCSSINCLGWRFAGPRMFGGSADTSPELAEELSRAFVEANLADIDQKVMNAAPQSFNDLIADMTSSKYPQDIRTFALKTKAMLLKMDRKVRSARIQGSIYQHLASIGIPKSMNCLSLRLAEEYSVNNLARIPLPPPEAISHLTDSSFMHLALITDNILAAAVVVSSAVKSSANPENIVVHIVTDKKTYAPMHSWFALNPAFPAIVEVKGLHLFDWPIHVSALVRETVQEINQAIWRHRYYGGALDEYQKLEALNPSSFSLLNFLRIHLPELFPELDKVIFLDDDVVVRRDLTPLWSLDLEGKVVGAARTREGKEGDYCIGKKFGDFLNFSNPVISSQFKRDQCAWLDGMNVFDLQLWRTTNITQTYQRWLKLNRDAAFTLWRLGSLPPALVAFDSQVYSIDPLWHLWGLGRQLPEDDGLLESAAVLHFSGPAKPWLEIGFPELRNIWRGYINYSDEFIRNCRILE